MEQRHRFSNPGAARAGLQSQWEAFQARGAILDGVRPEIAASWQRCNALELTSQMPAVPLDEGALRGFDHAGQARRQFLGLTRQLAGDLGAELADTNAAVIVCDDFGVVLYRTGSPEVLRRACEVNLVPGGVWSEPRAGTSGVGLALELGELAHVHAAEHYMGAFHGFSCTAVPVRHPVTQEVLGVLGLATGNDVSGSFACSLVARAGVEIQRQLEEQVFGRERELLEHYLRGRAGQAPFLTVDRSGHTIIQNARMLQTASGEDVQLLLSFARQALYAETDASEQLELSRGPSRAEVHLVHAGSDLLGALVSLQRPSRTRAGQGHASTQDWPGLVGRSPAIQSLLRQAAKVAQQRMAAVVYGEPGTGKLLLAELLHRIGGTGPLAIVHCARENWESEWAAAARPGSTVVLRRLHGLSQVGQLRLCDVLDELEASDGVWVMSLLNSQAESPSPELLSRLARVTLMVPALRDRGHDLRLLVDHWCDVRAQRLGRRPALRAEAHEALAAQPWPGNVRELHNALDAAALRAGTVIGVESLQLHSCSSPGLGSNHGNLREIEREAINAALERNGGNVSRAARDLGIGRATLHRRLRAYRLLSPPA